MSAWELNTANPSKAYARAVKYRIQAHQDGLCITDRKELAPTSKVYCSVCLAKHSDRVKRYNEKKKFNSDKSH